MVFHRALSFSVVLILTVSALSSLLMSVLAVKSQTKPSGHDFSNLDHDLTSEESILRFSQRRPPTRSVHVVRHVSPDHSEPVRQGTYLYGDFKLSKTSKTSGQDYLPMAQFCPDTGRTICKEIPTYPEDSILNLILDAKSRKFNFSSLFVDESENDSEPNLGGLNEIPPSSTQAQKSNGAVKGRLETNSSSVKAAQNHQKFNQQNNYQQLTISRPHNQQQQQQNQQPSWQLNPISPSSSPIFSPQLPAPPPLPTHQTSFRHKLVETTPTSATFSSKPSQQFVTGGRTLPSVQRNSQLTHALAQPKETKHSLSSDNNSGNRYPPPTQPSTALNNSKNGEEPPSSQDHLHASELHAQHRSNNGHPRNILQMQPGGLEKRPQHNRVVKPSGSKSSRSSSTRPRTSSGQYTMHLLPLSAPMASLLTGLDESSFITPSGQHRLAQWKPITAYENDQPSSEPAPSQQPTPCVKQDIGKGEKALISNSNTKLNTKLKQRTQLRATNSQGSLLQIAQVWPVDSLINQLQLGQLQLQPIAGSRSLQAVKPGALTAVEAVEQKTHSDQDEIVRYRRNVISESDWEEAAEATNDPYPESYAVEICKTRRMFISPKAAMNDRSEWRYIVNLGEKDKRMRQVIKVDVCESPNEPCSNQVTLPFGFSSRCKQKYIKKKLLALDPDGKGTSTENFFVPSCCVCEIFRDQR